MNLPHYFHTVRHLQWKQVYYRLYYKVKRPFFKPAQVPEAAINAALSFPAHEWHACLPGNPYRPESKTFSLLNRTHSFGNEPINWDFDTYGKLWAYNLNYFSWLEDETISVSDRLFTIQAYIAAAQHKNGDEPYPASLRGIHWIQFISRHKITDISIIKQLQEDYQRLAAFPEYHLGGNHLLENAFSLLWGAFFFKNEAWLKLAAQLLQQNLEEQVLPDGGHYERSAMYHCLLLYWLLQCIELMQQAPVFNLTGLLPFLQNKAALMLGWLREYCFADGSYAMQGDAAPDVAPSPASLQAFAQDLGIQAATVKMNESGYRKMKTATAELLVNAGNPGPVHQPGHSHADSLSFCIQVGHKPFIVDTGISTYDANNRRLAERGTAAHNTVSINNDNSSEVWKSFRMAQRASVEITGEQKDQLRLSHDGYYKKYGIIHCRAITCSDKKITVSDVIKNQKANKALLHLHFHPDVVIQQRDTGVFTASNGVNIILEGITKAHLEQYNFCENFNMQKVAQKLVATIDERADIVLEF
ncbi:heparinase II/III domain-containing protein [Chitinophagaceae bacterium MMS25-I14]